MDDVATCSPTACGCGLSIEPMDAAAADDLATGYKALGDPHRVSIVHLLAEAADAVCVVDIERHVDLSQSTISYHLKTLLDAGIVSRETRGRWSFYRLRPERLGRLGAALEVMASETIAT